MLDQLAELVGLFLLLARLAASLSLSDEASAMCVVLVEKANK